MLPARTDQFKPPEEMRIGESQTLPLCWPWATVPDVFPTSDSGPQTVPHPQDHLGSVLNLQGICDAVRLRWGP